MNTRFILFLTQVTDFFQLASGLSNLMSINVLLLQISQVWPSLWFITFHNECGHFLA